MIAMTGAFALVAALGGGVTYVLLKPADQKPAEPPPAPAAPAPLPAPAAAPTAKAPLNTNDTAAAKPPPETPPDASESAPDIATVEFAPTKAAFTITKPTAAYVSASTDAPHMYDLPAGLGVQGTEESKDGKWLVAQTQDGQAAFLPTAALGPYQASAAAAVPSLPATVDGTANVLDTATLSVDGQRVPLFGVTGETGALADQLQDLINGNGKQVSCKLVVQSYRCELPKNIDVAGAALYNGAARPGPDATDDYRHLADAARTAHKGVWQ
jgi:endonuclease YncB( thermonuclease family)